VRIALIALSVKGAMGQYLEALVPHIANSLEVHLFVPNHFKGDIGNAILHNFPTGETKSKALFKLLNPFLAKKIWNEIVEVKPDLIYLFNGEGYPWVLFWMVWNTKVSIPFLITLHDPEPHPGNLWEFLNGKFRKFVIKRAKSIHIHSNQFLETTKQLGAKNVIVIPHGSFADRFLQYKQNNIKREKAALFFGRLEAYKGIDILIEAGLLLNGKIKIIIAGPGKLPPMLLDKINQNPTIFELHNYFLTDSKVAELFQRASVCVLPYKQATQSAVPLIAAAFGVPVIASAVGGFLEDIPRVGGLLVPPNDPVALAKGIEQAIGITPLYPHELSFLYISKQFINWFKENV
jgi:glycosyltransferase involved in cell wall biosynthesis